MSKHTNTLIQKSLFISPVYFHINRLQRCFAFRKTFVWLNEKVRECIIARSYMSALSSRSLVNAVIPFLSYFPAAEFLALCPNNIGTTGDGRGKERQLFICVWLLLNKADNDQTKSSQWNDVIARGPSLLAWCLAGSSWPSQISTSAPSTPKSARTACVRTCWGRTNAPATKAMRWTCRAKAALVGGPLFNLLFEKENENPFSMFAVFVLLLRYGRVPDKQAAVWERSLQEHTGQLHLPVPQRIHLQSKDGRLRGWVAASSAHVHGCHLRPTICLFWCQQMWTSVSQTPVSMEIAGTAKGPLCVCVLWAVLWTTLAWSV